MTHTIKSDRLNINISSTGAELQSIYSPLTGTEYLWQGDAKWWGSRAPVLFPFIGASKSGRYAVNGKTFAAPRHGFVRSAYFHKAASSDNSLTLEYVDNPATRAVFPFRFTFQVTFTLDGSELRVDNRVVNHSAGPMPFLLGAHEAYSCRGFTDYYLEFDNGCPLVSEEVNLANGLLTGARYTVNLSNTGLIDEAQPHSAFCESSEPRYGNGGVLRLDYSLFDNDTLIFKNIGGGKVSLKSGKHASVIDVAYDAPNLAIWTKPGAEFVCIEPWFGLPGYENESLALAERPGAVTLMPGGEFVSTHTITIRGCGE
jgi:galactose mutarotase-like enzyme